MALFVCCFVFQALRGSSANLSFSFSHSLSSFLDLFPPLCDVTMNLRRSFLFHILISFEREYSVDDIEKWRHYIDRAAVVFNTFKPIVMYLGLCSQVQYLFLTEQNKAPAASPPDLWSQLSRAVASALPRGCVSFNGPAQQGHASRSILLYFINGVAVLNGMPGFSEREGVY